MNLHRVFVYGTLKSEEPNHHWLTKATNGYSKFLGTAFTKEKYPLIIGTKYNIPFLLYAPGEGNIVQGEVYEVDDEMLNKLDELEDHPNYYVRELYTVASKDKESENHRDIECWVYFIKTFNRDLLQQRSYSSYSSSGDHNLPYCERYNESVASDLEDR